MNNNRDCRKIKLASIFVRKGASLINLESGEVLARCNGDVRSRKVSRLKGVCMRSSITVLNSGCTSGMAKKCQQIWESTALDKSFACGCAATVKATHRCAMGKQLAPCARAGINLISLSQILTIGRFYITVLK